MPPETATGVNHTFFPPCLGCARATLTEGGPGRGQEGWEASSSYREREADFLALEPGPAALGFETISVSFGYEGCGFQPDVPSAYPGCGT